MKNTPSVIVIMGLPGSGKGTQAQKIAEKFQLKYLATGDIVRDFIKQDSATARQAKNLYQSGKLLPDELVTQMLEEQIKKVGGNRFIFDGFPRSPGQARGLEKIIKDFKLAQPLVLYLRICEKTVVDRLSKRFICPRCKSIFYPKSKGFFEKICPKCQVALVQRADDRPQAIKQRILESKNKLDPVLKFYKEKGQLIIINGEPPVPEVTKEIFKKLEEKIS